jgi:HSP20 family protein
MTAFADRFWEPWAQLERFQHDMNRLFTQGGRAPWATAQYPGMNIWTGEEGAMLTAMLPGVTPETLDISVLGQTLTLRGRREALPLKQDEAYHRRERPHGEFSRTVELPFRVDAQKVVAQFKDGVLELMLPRAAEDKPRRITVKAN